MLRLSIIRSRGAKPDIEEVNAEASMEYLLKPAGFVRGGRGEATDDDWGHSRARIELDPDQFNETALQGLSDFSHAEVVYVFDRVTDDEIVTGARHPRGRKDWPKIG